MRLYPTPLPEAFSASHGTESRAPAPDHGKGR